MKGLPARRAPGLLFIYSRLRSTDLQMSLNVSGAELDVNTQLNGEGGWSEQEVCVTVNSVTQAACVVCSVHLSPRFLVVNSF